MKAKVNNSWVDILDIYTKVSGDWKLVLFGYTKVNGVWKSIYQCIPYNDLVDLGLPSGLLWAKGNVVSDGNGGYKIGNLTDYGAYISWGNIVPHFSSNGSTFDDGYNWGSSTTVSPYKNTIGATISFSSDTKGADILPNSGNDAARELLGGLWRLPTGLEFQELINNCTNKWFASGNTEYDGVAGMEYTSNINGAKLFFPASGFSNDNGIGLKLRNIAGRYWSSSLNSSTKAYNAMMDSGSNVPAYASGRYSGRSFRAVILPTN